MINPAHDARTFELTDRIFGQFKRLAEEKTGISLDDTNRAMISARFSRRVRALGLDGFEQYLELLSQPKHPECVEFIDTVTTNLTYFFRESHHFDMLGKTILPELQKDKSIREPIRIWSAGCSSGQEPYSIAMTAADANCLGPRPLRILCTDIDSKMVRQTEDGCYTSNELRGITPDQLQRWCTRLPAGKVQINEQLKSLLICRHLNLFGPWPIHPGVDVIFCRNVLIYFDIAGQEQVVRGMASVQTPGGKLMLGHSENISHSLDVYKRVSNTIYERV